ncbi:MAG: hypothetical protein HZA06_02115 [Nitrospirae bacterium]|nr:hypothetical protein [Nitrospirota bacterium]
MPGEKRLYKIIIEKPLISRCNTKEIADDITGQFVKSLENHVSMHPGYMHFLDIFYPGGLIEQRT